MITYPDKKRCDAQEAYSHKWIQTKCENAVDPSDMKDALNNLKNFHVLISIIISSNRLNINYNKQH